MKLPYIWRVSNQTEFATKVLQVSNALSTSQYFPIWLMLVMNNESGVNSKAVNPSSGATGLIQFTSYTANYLGTTLATLKSMTNIQQLNYVYAYLAIYKNSINNASDLYLAIFYPLALFKPNSYQFPTNVVQYNPIFDLNGDGVLTKAEFINYVNQKFTNDLNSESIPTQTTDTLKTIAEIGFFIGGLIAIVKQVQKQVNKS